MKTDHFIVVFYTIIIQMEFYNNKQYVINTIKNYVYFNFKIIYDILINFVFIL